MAFIEIFLVFSIAGTLVFLGLFALLFLIIGKVLKNKKKKGSAFFKTLSVICTIIFAVIVLYIFIPRYVKINTPQGTKKVWSTEIDEVRGLVESSRETGKINTKAVKKIISEKPELIYYTDYYYVSYEDYPSLLEWAVFYGEFELADFLIEHGVEFDNKLVYKKLIFDTSLESYFYDLINIKNEKKYRASTEIIEYMAEKEADFEKILLSEYVYKYIFDDEEISDDEVEIIKALIEKGADIYAKSGNYKPYDVFMKIRKKYGSEIEADENYKAIVEILE